MSPGDREVVHSEWSGRGGTRVEDSDCDVAGALLHDPAKTVSFVTHVEGKDGAGQDRGGQRPGCVRARGELENLLVSSGSHRGHLQLGIDRVSGLAP